jgi:hypothetical protein
MAGGAWCPEPKQRISSPTATGENDRHYEEKKIRTGDVLPHRMPQAGDIGEAMKKLRETPGRTEK